MECAGRSQREWHTVMGYGMVLMESLHAQWFAALGSMNSMIVRRENQAFCKIKL
jgi:hypothetical protein